MSEGDVEMVDAPQVEEGWVDVSEAQDGGILKKILREGSGPTATAGAEVNVYYHGKLDSDGSTFDSNLEGPGFNFELGAGRVIKGWDQGVATMSKGEKATLKIREDYGYGKSGSPPKIPGGATLLFDVELLSFSTGKDITESKNGGVVKKEVHSKGEGYQTPKEDGTVTAHVIVTANGEEVFNTRSGEPLKWVVGDDPLADGVTRGLDLAASKFKKGERAVVEVRADYAYGEEGYSGSNGPKVSPNTDLVYDLEVVDFENPPESWSLNGAEEKVNAAIKKKEAANGKFQEKRYAKAQRMYKAAMAYIQYGEWGDREQEVNDLKVTLHLNQVACMMAQKGFDQKAARTAVKEALKLSPRNVKALYRSAKLYASSGTYPEAIADLKRALEVEPENAAVKKEIARVVSLQKRQDQKDKAMYARMFK